MICSTFSRQLLASVIILAVPVSALAITIDTVLVGNAGNAPDPLTGNLYGSVSYEYRIGKTEVTNAQYAAFLNEKAKSDPLGLYHTLMGSNAAVARGGITRSGSDGSYTYSTKTNMGNKPVNYVSWYDAIRFANWLHNGQGSGDTETGAYTLLGGTWPSNGMSITRNVGAKWWLPSEDEWYKAAYHQPADQGGDSDDYWLYPTASNTAPTAQAPPGGTNSTNFMGGPVNDVGAYVDSLSPYGTYDQGGNVWEWNETLIVNEADISDSFRGVRGGSFDNAADFQVASFREFNRPWFEISSFGFRVATVPEPSTVILLAFATLGLIIQCYRRRQAK